LRADDRARAAGMLRAHFNGESPHAYRISRRLERAAALLRCADRSAAEICSALGLSSVGSFTTSFCAFEDPTNMPLDTETTSGRNDLAELRAV
jgi:AraC-like DNA-binding protein